MPGKTKKRKKQRDAWGIRCIRDGTYLGRALIVEGRADFYCRHCKQFTTIEDWPPGKTDKKKGH